MNNTYDNIIGVHVDSWRQQMMMKKKKGTLRLERSEG